MLQQVFSLIDAIGPKSANKGAQTYRPILIEPQAMPPFRPHIVIGKGDLSVCPRKQ
jgi:hypothetical protein